MKKVLGLAVAGILTAGAANAGEIKTANSDITVKGGITAGYFYANNVGNNNNDYFEVSNVSVDFLAEPKPIGFNASFGYVHHATLLDPTPDNNTNVEIDFAWVSIKPVEGLTIDAGKLLTNVGYELYDLYENKNHFYGLVWNAQPVAYAGARATYSVMEGLDVYAEYDQNALNTNDAYAVGALGSIENVNFAVNYFDEAGGNNIADLVLSTELELAEVGLNFDYIWQDDTAKQKGKDNSAYGIAIYASVSPTETVEIPVRLEHVEDGTSGIYGVAGDDAWTFTVSPTWRPTKNTFARAELAYVTTGKSTFYDNDNKPKSTRTLAGVELGFTF